MSIRKTSAMSYKGDWKFARNRGKKEKIANLDSGYILKSAKTEKNTLGHETCDSQNHHACFSKESPSPFAVLLKTPFEDNYNESTVTWKNCGYKYHQGHHGEHKNILSKINFNCSLIPLVTAIKMNFTAARFRFVLSKAAFSAMVNKTVVPKWSTE